MTAFVIDQFSGIAPKIAPRLLNNSLAQTAANARLDSGRLEALPNHSSEVVSVPSGTKTIYLYSDTYWKNYSTYVEIVDGPIVNDVTERVYYTGDSYPKVYRNDGGPFRLGVPAPTTVPTVTIAGTPDTGALEETRHYVVTFVTAWGEEGPPSNASTAAIFKEGQNATIVLPDIPLSGGYNFTTGALKRIYRTNTGSEATSYQFVAEVAYSTSTHVDTVASAALGEVIPSITWMRPADDDSSLFPTGPLKGLCSIGNGIMAGFTGNTLCFSVPYLPHAWPIEFQVATAAPIVAIKPIPGGLVIGTEGKPYVAMGVDPSAISLVELESNQACVSAQSMVDMGDYVIYASPDGLVAVQGTKAQLLTETLLTRDQWQAYNPETMEAMAYEGVYIASHTNGSILFDIRAGKNALTTCSDTFVGGYSRLETDTLYFVDGTSVKKFGQGSGTYSYTWKSKPFVTQKPTNLSWAKVSAESYPITFKLYGDNAEKSSVTVQDSEPFRLPSGYRSTEWEIELSGTPAINSVSIADNLDELV